MAHLFVYGSLMVPEVRQLILGKDLSSISGVIKGYERCSVLDTTRVAKGPVLREQKDAFVDGVVLLDVDGQTIEQLDRFERGFERIEVLVWTGDSELDAWCYITDTTRFELVTPGWSLADFIEYHLPTYRERIREGQLQRG